MLRRGGLILALVLVVVAGDGFPVSAPSSSSAQIPTSRSEAGFGPAQHAGRAYKNVDPDYRRASYWARLHSLVVGSTWLVTERLVAALPAGTPDWDALRHGAPTPTVTWIGHSTVLVQLDG